MWLGAGVSYPQSLSNPRLGFFLQLADTHIVLPPSVPLLSRLSWGSRTDSFLPCALGMTSATDENQTPEGSCLPLGGAEMLLTSRSLPPAPGLVCCLFRASCSIGLSQEWKHEGATRVRRSGRALSGLWGLPII